LELIPDIDFEHSRSFYNDLEYSRIILNMIWNIFEFAVKNKYISQKSEGIFLERNSLLHNLSVLCLIHGLLDNIIAISLII